MRRPEAAFRAPRPRVFGGCGQPPPSAWNRLTTACRRASRAWRRLSWAWNRGCWVFSTVTRSTAPSRSRVSEISNARRELSHHLALQPLALRRFAAPQ